MKKASRIMVIAVILLSVFTLMACGGDKHKIDIGGEVVKKMTASCQVRIMLENDIFSRYDDLKIKVGFGFSSEQNVPFYIGLGAILVLKIEAMGFAIADEAGNEDYDEYEKMFEEFSDSKFVCTLDRKRYIPNYYEMFDLKLASATKSGAIQISITNLAEGTRDGRGDGQTRRVYYASNDEKIAFSSKSIEDAQKKL